MRHEKNNRRDLLSWLFVCALFALCGVLGWLQYRWIGEVSVAARERLRGALQASLSRISQEFNSELSTACRALTPSNSPVDAAAVETEVTSRYRQWKQTARHNRIFAQIAIAEPAEGGLTLRRLDLADGALKTAEWPPDWSALRDRLESKLPAGPRRAGPPGWQQTSRNQGLAFELPLFPPDPIGAPGQPGQREIAWMIFEPDLAYVREALLPEILQRHLGSGGVMDYQAEVVSNATPRSVIYQSDPGRGDGISDNADASIGLFDDAQVFHVSRAPDRPPNAMHGRGPGRGRGPGPGMPPMFGRGPGSIPGTPRGQAPGSQRWTLFVRHRAGSLEAAVSQTRQRNLAVTAGVLLLMLLTVASLIRFTRKAEKLAGLQMEFVAGVSHELRTPLTVIHTAAYNLQGKMAGNPALVQAHAALIQQESGRLKELVEQVLRFANVEAGRVIQEPEPVSVEDVIDESMESSKALIQGCQCMVERRLDPGLPFIMADPMALRHALQNLISNAVKYGSKGGNWIGIFASRISDRDGAEVEIRVADHGPGIPEAEREHIFEPFFRGARAIQDQIHGTGLGLSLVKKIVEAHGGSIRVESTPMAGTEFIMRIPVAPAGAAG